MFRVLKRGEKEGSNSNPISSPELSSNMGSSCSGAGREDTDPHWYSQKMAKSRPTIPVLADTVMMRLERLMGTLKSKLSKSLRMKKGADNYDKIEKSESMRVEIRSRKARKLIEESLKFADSPKTKTFAF
ncbi:hypothetical protein RJ639_009659 [Escallonia herrerae]|uniref:Uncharacterized protein n=1 Tax=Escallonia herrerae TaxID=1293975 RepID=A0AA88VS94_9ASTE|nr:hypothetical protein RJ639_009659 [Escallonia herrerae]